MSKSSIAPNIEVDKFSAPLSFFLTAIESFKACFSYQRSFVWFVIVMMGLIVRQDFLGVSSIIRWLDLPEKCYPCCVHFFRSTAWNLKKMLSHWWGWLRENVELLEVNSRIVLLGDHTNQPKEARCMPGVVTISQNSETSSKPGFFRGHNWGFISVLIQKGQDIFSCPLWAQLHQGHHDLGEREGGSENITIPKRLVNMAIEIAKRLGREVYLVLDAFFASSTVFSMAQSISDMTLNRPLIHIITRAKCNCVAYEEPVKEEKRGRGRPRKYGRKIKLIELFNTMKEKFEIAHCFIYSHEEDVSYLCLDLLWKQLGEKIRFVLAITSRGPIMLMCTDLHLNPMNVLELYCHRVKIETMFNLFKHAFGGLCYRFWSRFLTPQSRHPKKNKDFRRTPSDTSIPYIQKTWQAIERFVNITVILQGILQVISLNFGTEIWGTKVLWLRTHSRLVPSEFIVRHLLAKLLLSNFRNILSAPIFDKIQTSIQKANNFNIDSS